MNNSTLVHINQLPPTIYGRPALLMQRFRHDLTLARLSILRVRFLLHATALNSHTSCFHASLRRDRSPECRLCDLSVPEDIFHFIAQCPALDHVCAMWIPKIYSTPPDPALLVDHVLGISGLDSLDQHSLLRFLADLYSFRYTISSIPPSRRRYSSQTRRLKNLRRRSSPWDQENSSQGKSKVIQAIRRAKWSIKSQFCFCNRATIYNYQYFRAIFCFRRL